MRMFQDGVEIIIPYEFGHCTADAERRHPVAVDDCPIGCDFCTPDCMNYEETWGED